AREPLRPAGTGRPAGRADRVACRPAARARRSQPGRPGGGAPAAPSLRPPPRRRRGFTEHPPFARSATDPLRMEPATSETSTPARSRVNRALRTRKNWEQLVKFCVVGASGYVVNLAVYALLVRRAHVHYIPAAAASFAVAVTNNYTWNRL